MRGDAEKSAAAHHGRAGTWRGSPGLPAGTPDEERVMGRRLYVGNLPYTTGEAELQELFSKAGTVESVRVMRDAATGRARGFGFVEMSTEQAGREAEKRQELRRI